MTWFNGVPDRVSITRSLDFLPAGEALWEVDPDEVDPWLERPEDDFGATAILLQARLQLDQMVEVLRCAPMASAGDDLGGALGSVSIVDDTEAPGHDFIPNEPGQDIARVKEALLLLEELQHHVGVSHGFAPDGSISITTGPDIPACPALLLRGSSDGGEMHDSPLQILASAIEATRAAARLTTALESGDGGTISLREYP